MHRVKLDRASPAIKNFVRSLPVDSGEVQLELNGRVVCKILSPREMMEEQKEAILARGRELLKKTRARNRGVPAKVIEREVREAVAEVRRRKQQ